MVYWRWGRPDFADALVGFTFFASSLSIGLSSANDCDLFILSLVVLGVFRDVSTCLANRDLKGLGVMKLSISPTVSSNTSSSSDSELDSGKTKSSAVQLIQAKCLIHKPQHNYEWAKQSVCTCDNKKQSVHRPYWGRKRAVAFAVSAQG